MAFNKRIAKRAKAMEVLDNLYTNSSHTLIIHYSCESFYDIVDGRSPRITAIAVRYMETGQTKTFSIHKTAEKQQIAFDQIESNANQLEKDMLREFYAFVNHHKSHNWVHWNMRDVNYGFEAIEHRFSVLGGRPTIIDDNRKFDLARLLVDMYGLRYASHPRFENLVKLNGMTIRDFLTGAQEAEAFKQKEYVKLHQSTLRKVDLLHSISEKAVEGDLKTEAKFKDIYGLSAQGIYIGVKDNWMFVLLFGIFWAVVGALVSKLFG